MVEKILKFILTDGSCRTDKELEEYLQKVTANIPVTYHFSEDRCTVYIIPTEILKPIKISFIN